MVQIWARTICELVVNVRHFDTAKDADYNVEGSFRPQGDSVHMTKATRELLFFSLNRTLTPEAT